MCNTYVGAYIPNNIAGLYGLEHSLIKGLLVILFSRQELVNELNHTRLARNIAQADRCRIGLPAHASFIAYDLAFLYLAGLGERVT